MTTGYPSYNSLLENYQVVSSSYAEFIAQGGGGKTSYLAAYLSGAQSTNIATGDHIKFNVVSKSTGSYISLDTTSVYSNGANTASLGRFALTANKTYQMTFQGGYCVYSSAAGQIQLSWWDSDSEIVLQPGTVLLNTSYVAAFAGSTGTMDVIYTPSSNTRVEVRLRFVSAITSVGAADTSDISGSFSMNPHVVIKELL